MYKENPGLALSASEKLDTRTTEKKHTTRDTVPRTKLKDERKPETLRESLRKTRQSWLAITPEVLNPWVATP